MFDLGLMSGSRSASHVWQPPAVEELQRILPQYEISAFIARGGMGAVYKGIQKNLRRIVAIKVLPPHVDVDDLQYAARFKHEAQAMAQLTHPNIVAVYDAGETADGLLYFVMEFIEGTDVARLIASEGKVDQKVALGIISEVCDALGFAHESGIIHRDIKPSNIMLDRRGHVKVADFGLAKTVTLDATQVTGTKLAMGSPDFIAPEAMVPGIQVDKRADLYSVGVMLYQMLTGKIPRGRFERLTRAVPGIDKRLDAIVDRAMQSEPDARYSNATELRTALDPITRSLAKRHPTTTVAKAQTDVPVRGGGGMMRWIFAGVAVLVVGLGAIALKKKLPKSGAESAKSIAGATAQPLHSKEHSAIAAVDRKDAAQPKAGQPPPKTPPQPKAKRQWKKVELAALPQAEVAQDAKYSEVSAGELHLRRNDAWFSPGPFVNGAVRATIHWTDKTSSPQVLVRKDANRPRYYLRALPDGSAELGIKGTGETVLARYPGGAARKAGDQVQLQLACIGRQLTAWMDGRQLGSLDDSTITDEGSAGIQGNDADFTALESIKLDGMMESDALRMASLDAAGKVMPSAAAEVPALPMTGWKPFIADVAAVKTKPGVSVLSDGWLRMEGAYLEGPHLRNVALRARLRFQRSTAWALKVRESKLTHEAYTVAVSSDGSAVSLRRMGVDANGGNILAKVTLPSRIAAGQEYELALAASGDVLTVYLDGKPIIYELDTLCREDGVTLGASAMSEVKNVEWLSLGGTSTAATATVDAPFVNSLGMKLVPVPIAGGPTDKQRVLFSVWETRVQDYQVFVDETKRAWPKPGFHQEPTHPAVMVSWDDAQAFCAWLTWRGRKFGKLSAGERYRLPTDHEWSCAIGIGRSEVPSKSPEQKSQELQHVFPWGAWPPGKGAGNYSGDEATGHESRKDQSVLAGYRDGFPYTAPVGSFEANRFGLYDLGGNAWEWCDDPFNATEKSRVMRGAGFSSGGREELFSSKRDRHPSDERKDSYGFRVVLSAGGESAGTGKGAGN